MKARKVISREYKVMLRAEKFAGTEQDVLIAAGQLWGEIARIIEPIALKVSGTLDTISKKRLVSFLDSEARQLWAGGYIFRVRRSPGGRRPEVTLKFRHPDRYVAESRQMKSRRIRTSIKFEEDIKQPFVSLYGYSTTGRVRRKAVPTTLEQVSALFPDLSKRIVDMKCSHELEVVGFTAREVVVSGSFVRIGVMPQVSVECALIVWYNEDERSHDPVAVEFSYRYGNPSGRYSGKAAKRAFDMFEALQRDLTEWVGLNARTKTACVYDGLVSSAAAQ